MQSTCFYISVSALPLIAFLVMSCFAPKGVWKMGKRAKANPDLLGEAIVRRTVEVGQIANLNLSDEISEHEYLLDKINKSIDYAISRHDWYERQRHNILQLSLAAATVIFGICGLSLKLFVSPLPITVVFFAVFSALLGILGVWVALFRYNSELDGDRPYRLVSDIRFWFFRYNLPNHSNASSNRSAKTAGQLVLSERTRFFERISENFSLDNSVREDLEQLFILQVLQRHKSESLTKMRWTLVYLIYGFSFQVLIAFALFFLARFTQ